MIAAGLKPFSHADYERERRFYFLDPDGIEYEVVSYPNAALSLIVAMQKVLD